VRLEHIDISDDLAAECDRLWPDATWSAVIAHALTLAVERAHRGRPKTGGPKNLWRNEA
jgi:hypothetical protein